MKKIVIVIVLFGLMLMLWNCGGGTGSATQSDISVLETTAVPSPASSIVPAKPLEPSSMTSRSEGSTDRKRTNDDQARRIGGQGEVNESSYDINCIMGVLGQAITDDIAYRGRLPTAEELASIQDCKLMLVQDSVSSGEGSIDRKRTNDDQARRIGEQGEVNESSYDINCIMGVLGQAITDDIAYRGRPPTAEELASIQDCKLNIGSGDAGSSDRKRTHDDEGRRIDGQGEQSYDSSGWTFNCSGFDLDDSGIPTVPSCNLIPPPLPSGVTKGELLSVSLPNPSYHEPVEGCQLFDQGQCAELNWGPVADLQGGEFVAIEISLTNPDVMYAGVDSNDMSMYRSLDGGASWDLVHVAGHVGGIAISPINPNNVIYTNLETANFQTLDGGMTWKRVVGKLPGEGLVSPLTAIAFSKDDPRIAYTTALDVVFETGRGGTWPPHPSGVYKSSDEGKTWKRVGVCDICGSIQTIVVVEGDSNFVWAAADGGLFFSKDGGRNWSGNVIGYLDETRKRTENINKNILPKVVGLSLQPGNPDTMLAASSEFGMFRSTDGGASWVPSNEGLNPSKLHRVQFSLSNPNVAYVATHDGVFRSDDAGESWTERNHGLLDKHVNPIAIHPLNEDIVFVGTSNEIYTIHPEHQRRGLIEHGGMYKTVDGGKNWVRTDKGIIEAKIAQIGAHPLIPFNLWVGGESGRGNFFSPDGGASWLFSGSMAAHYPMVYAFSYDFPTVMWATGWQKTGELSGSTNGGANWFTRTHKLDEGLSSKTRELGLRLEGANDFHIHGVAVAPSDSNIVYVGSVHDSVYSDLVFNLEGAHIFKSSDGGETFPEMSNGFPIETKTSINAIVVHPEDPDTAYVMTSLHESETSIGIYKTINGAQSWFAVNEGLDPYTNDLQMDPINPEVLYAATESGIYKTTNGARTWKKASGGIPKGPVIDMAIDPLNPLILYAITPEDIYRTQDGAMHWYSVNLGIPLLRDSSLTLSVQDSLLRQLALDRTNTGHSMYGGTFAQDRTLEIDATGRVIVVAVKTNRNDADKRSERILYRAVLNPLVNVVYEFSINDPMRDVNETTVKVVSQSNIYDMFFDSNLQRLKLTAAGPPGTTSKTTVIVPESLLSGGAQALVCCINVYINGSKISSSSTNSGITFEYVHTGRDEVVITTTQ